MTTRECDKLKKREAEWNAIFPFMEWLTETKQLVLATSSKEGLYEGPNDLQALLYEYFDVDPYTLEVERQLVLSKQRELNAKEDIKKLLERIKNLEFDLNLTGEKK